MKHRVGMGSKHLVSPLLYLLVVVLALFALPQE